MNKTNHIPYPRRWLVRKGYYVFGNLLVDILCNATITGRENIPKEGPVILVGNHIELMEVFMMVLISRRPIELMGAADVPFEPMVAPVVNTYGYIPVKRGSMDRPALEQALSILQQGGVIGLFPEGGIWETKLRQAHTGVSWLSDKANAPIVPIGFGGMAGAVKAAFRFKNPKMTVNIGEPIPPINTKGRGKSRKDALSDAAQMVMSQVETLIPDEEKARWKEVVEETFALDIRLTDPVDDSEVSIPPDCRIEEPELLAKILHRPVLLKTLSLNLRMPIQALQDLHHDDPAAFAEACEVFVNYLDNDNPFYLTYRFGVEQGKAMRETLLQLRDLAQWAAENDYRLRISATHCYRHKASEEEFVHRVPA